MIKESIKIHGNRQFEVKQKVSFPKNKNEVKYSVDTYFFLPSALQINSNTYDKTEFQRNLKGYVRMRAPNESLKNMLEPNGRLTKLRAFIEQHSENTDLATEAEYEDSLKQFALSYKRALRKTVLKITRHSQVQSQKEISELLERMSSVLKAYRALSSIVIPYENKMGSMTYRYCDEYLSIVSSYYLKTLYFHSAEANQRSDAVRQFWVNEVAYQKEHYPIQIPPGETDRSAFILRWSVLKKYVSSCLFLDVRYRKGAPLLIHSLYGIAAALSMFFATVVAFVWQDRYGSLSMNLFIAMIIAYIFKDRIKEISRDWLAHLFRRWIPDRRLIIYREPDIEVGTCKESFDYLDRAHLPEVVRTLREQSHWNHIVHDRMTETVFRYKKEITIKNYQELFQKSNHSLIDITRFNISDYLRNIDGKFEELPVFDEEEERIVGEKLYHLYMLRAVKFNGQTDAELVRIVVNVDGIKRIMLVKPLSQGTTAVEVKNNIEVQYSLTEKDATSS